MSFLNSLKSMVGVGSPTIEISLKKTTAAIHEPVKGIVSITGGEYASEIDEIVFHIITTEEIKDKDKLKEDDEKLCKITMNDYTIEPSETIHVPFQIRIPKGIHMTSTSIKNYIQATLAISGKNVSNAAEITII